MRCAIFGTGPRATHVVLAGDRVPAGTVLVTPGLERPMGLIKACNAISDKTHTIKKLIQYMQMNVLLLMVLLYD